MAGQLFGLRRAALFLVSHWNPAASSPASATSAMGEILRANGLVPVAVGGKLAQALGELDFGVP